MKIDYKAIVKEAYDSGKDRDATIIEIFSKSNGSVTLNRAVALFTKYAKELGIETRTRQTGFRESFYEYLKEKPRTDKEAEAYVKANGSGNDVRHLKHYLGIAELARDIHNAK